MRGILSHVRLRAWLRRAAFREEAQEGRLYYDHRIDSWRRPQRNSGLGYPTRACSLRKVVTVIHEADNTVGVANVVRTRGRTSGAARPPSFTTPRWRIILSAKITRSNR